MPITAARRMYSRSPCGRSQPIGRSPARSPHRRTSGEELLEPSASTISRRASDLPLRIAKGGPCPAQTADNVPHFTPSTGWPLSVGIGGRIGSDSAPPAGHNPSGQLGITPGRKPYVRGEDADYHG